MEFDKTNSYVATTENFLDECTSKGGLVQNLFLILCGPPNFLTVFVLVHALQMLRTNFLDPGKSLSTWSNNLFSLLRKWSLSWNIVKFYFPGYAHGLVFNILHKAVHGPVVNDFITSLAVHLLELALTFPQTEYSGKVRIFIKFDDF